MQFKNTLLAISALVSAAIWAPQAQAIPAFARQVGMACSACHYQHFPVLNSFRPRLQGKRLHDDRRAG